MRTMRFAVDVSVPGRFFPRGAVVRVVPAGAVALVLPDRDAHATLCPVPAHALQPVRRFRAWLFHRDAGLAAAQDRFAADATELEAQLALELPECDLLDIEDIDEGA